MSQARLNASLGHMITVTIPIASVIARDKVRRQFVTRVRAR
jgi:hypothetical protein